MKIIPKTAYFKFLLGFLLAFGLTFGGEFSVKDIRDTMAKIASALERVDTLARTVAMAEIPVGIITSLVGAPFLIALLRSKAKELLK